MLNTTEIRVRGYHLDLYGHVNNARYLEFLEEGRWNFLEEVGELERISQSQVGMVVVNININYRYAARMNERLLVHTWMSELKERSAVMKQRIVLKDAPETLVVDADITFVIVDKHSGKSQRLEGPLRDQLQGWLLEHHPHTLLPC